MNKKEKGEIVLISKRPGTAAACYACLHGPVKSEKEGGIYAETVNTGYMVRAPTPCRIAHKNDN